MKSFTRKHLEHEFQKPYAVHALPLRIITAVLSYSSFTQLQ